jgi:5-hydroxyisourate hydrolase-like protein (transthyretin family)
MTRTGTITGRIREADSRQPVAGVTVQLLHPEYGVTGERTLRTVDTVRTNDRGEYRLYFVTPGRYYIGAGGDQRRTGRTSLQNTLQNNSNQIPVDYAAAFYPGVTNTPNATMVEVRPDAEVAAIDFFVRKHALYRIRGRVLDSTSGQPPAAATFSLFRQADVRWERVEIVNNYRSSDGSFTLTGLVPGSYSIVVSARRSAPRGIALPATPTGPRVVRVGFQVVQSRPAEDAPGYAQKATAVEIVGSDVDGVTIPVSPGVLLEGRLGVESGIIPNNLDSLAVSMRSLDRLVTTTSRTSAIGTPGERTLRFNDVAPGDYRVSVSGLPAGFYAKQATFAGADVLQRVMRVASGDVNRLNVVISSSVASLDGIVRNERSDAVAGSAVVLIPDERDRTELFQRVKTGSDGRFTFPAIAPGSYKVFAWETLESYAYFDAELVRQVEQSGKAIQLGESARQSVELKIIPAN